MPSWLGAPELIVILLIVIVLFGAKKLPELARGSGRALRIFKSETKGLMDDDDDDNDKPESQAQITKKDEAKPPVTDQSESAAPPRPNTQTEK